MKKLIRYCFKKFGYEIRKIEKVKINTDLWASLNKHEIRRIFHYEQILATKHLKGDIIECGVAMGATIAFVKSLQKEIDDTRNIYAFDTFEGFPQGSEKDASWFHEKGRPGSKKNTIDYVKNFLRKAGVSEKEILEINFVKGLIPDTFLQFPKNCKVSLINVDVDLYEPTFHSLNFFWPKLVRGGRIMLDEYDFGEDATKWPGAKLAVDEFCSNYGCLVSRHYTGKSYIEKNE